MHTALRLRGTTPRLTSPQCRCRPLLQSAILPSLGWCNHLAQQPGKAFTDFRCSVEATTPLDALTR